MTDYEKLLKYKYEKDSTPESISIDWDYENKELNEYMEDELCDDVSVDVNKKEFKWINKVKELSKWKMGTTINFRIKDFDGGVSLYINGKCSPNLIIDRNGDVLFKLENLKFERFSPKISSPKTYITNNKMPSVDYKVLYEQSQKENEELKDELNDWRESAQEHSIGDPSELLVYLNEVKEDKDEYDGIIEYTQALTGSPSSAEEIIYYIKERIEDKDEYDNEIDVLKKSVAHYKKTADDYYCLDEMNQSKVSSFDEMKSECEQLRKYNEKLKQFSMEVHNFAFSTEYDDLDIVSAFDLDSIIEELKKDEDNFNGFIEDLQKEIKTLKNKE